MSVCSHLALARGRLLGHADVGGLARARRDVDLDVAVDVREVEAHAEVLRVW